MHAGGGCARQLAGDNRVRSGAVPADAHGNVDADQSRGAARVARLLPAAVAAHLVVRCAVQLCSLCAPVPLCSPLPGPDRRES